MKLASRRKSHEIEVARWQIEASRDNMQTWTPVAVASTMSEAWVKLDELFRPGLSVRAVPVEAHGAQ